MSKLEHAGASSTTPSGAARSDGAPHRFARACRASTTGTTSFSAALHHRPRLADRHHRAAVRAQRRREIGEVAALVLAADDGDDACSKLSIDFAAASMLVAFESLTNRTPPRVATTSMTCSRPWKPASARASDPLDRAGQMADRRRGDDVAQHVAALQLHRRQRQQRDVALRGSLPHEAVADVHVGARRCRRRSSRRVPAHWSSSLSPPRCLHSQPPSRPAAGSRRSAVSPPRRRPHPDGDRGGRVKSSGAPQSTAGTSRSFRAGSCWSR